MLHLTRTISAITFYLVLLVINILALILCILAFTGHGTVVGYGLAILAISCSALLVMPRFIAFLRYRHGGA
jgi:hypothetical protein